MTAARRLAVILAAGVVGYSRLMDEEEAGTERRAHWDIARAIDRIGVIPYKQRVY